MKTITKLWHSLKQSMQYSLSNSAHQFVAVGSILFFALPLFYFIWLDGFKLPNESLWLRVLGSLLGLGLMLTPYWPKWSKPMMPWYWFLTLLYVLSFFFAYTFLINEVSIISAMSLLCSVFLLVLLVDVYSLFILLVLGWGLAFICYYFGAPQIHFGEEHIEMGLIVLFVVIAGSTLSYKTTALQQQRLAGMAAAAGMIAHELRTPLLGIKSGAQALANFSPTLFEAYRLAKKQGLLVSTTRESRVNQLEGVSDRIVGEIDAANTMIDMLLIKAGQGSSLQHCVLEPCSMAECLSEALERYPFQSSHARELVSWQGDFQFIGSKLLMQHVIFNLVKNALYAIDTAQRGCINIWTESHGKKKYLYVKDTAVGLSPHQRACLFQHFYTTNLMGTGLGLSFCKLVMLCFGGDIQCESQEGEFTTFILSFP
jgi:signal transduction histidine kinase